MVQRATFSVIAPAKDEEELIEEFHQRVAAALEPLGEPFEIIIVNDGSSDRTPEILRELNRRDPRFRSLTLSRSFGAEPAFTAGIDYAAGDAVILIDSDLQDPPEVIPELIAKWREGYELVYAVRASREGETWFKKVTAATFYRLMDRITSVNVPLDTGTFRLMDRSVVRALSQMRERNRSMRLLTVWTGFKQTGVPFRRQARKAGSTKYPLRKMIRLTLDNVTSFSYVPLQLATYFRLRGGRAERAGDARGGDRAPFGQPGLLRAGHHADHGAVPGRRAADLPGHHRRVIWAASTTRCAAARSISCRAPSASTSSRTPTGAPSIPIPTMRFQVEPAATAPRQGRLQHVAG